MSSLDINLLIAILRDRFEKNMSRHINLFWGEVQARLVANSEKLWSLNEMENTGGEPDVVGFDQKSGEFIFYGQFLGLVILKRDLSTR